MTYRIPEGRLIIEAVKKSGKLLMVGSQGKTSPLTAKAREVVKTGSPGQAQHGPAGRLSQFAGRRVGLSDPVRRLASDDRLGALAGLFAEASLRSEAFLPLALLVGVFGRGDNGFVGASVHHLPRDHGRQRAQERRGAGRHLPLERRPHLPGPDDRRLRVPRLSAGDHRQSRQLTSHHRPDHLGLGRESDIREGDGAGDFRAALWRGGVLRSQRLA